MPDKNTHITVDGIVAARNHQPYIRLIVNGETAELTTQLTIAEAKKIANDLYSLAARTEADAMILKFFSEKDFPPAAGAAIMMEFRGYRQAQDEQPVEGVIVDPDTGEDVT
jgi:hypothetical protein